jgi:hypothetical protein
MTSPTQWLDGASVNLSPFWTALVARLSTPTILRLLNGGKVYRGTDDYSRDERSDSGPWGRLVVLPIDTLWPATLPEPDRVGLAWLVRSEVRAPTPLGSYDVAGTVGRLQQLLWEQQRGWAPAPADVGVVLTTPIWAQRPPQRMPEYESGRRMWWSSSEWRAEGSRPV